LQTDPSWHAEVSSTTERLREEIAAGTFLPAQPTVALTEEPSETGKHNLPASRISFVGREHEMMEIKRHRLEGLPLAIELAAARIKLLPLLSRLKDRLKLLRGGARDFSERQRTLWSTIEWSYELLEEDQKALFRRLSGFSGGAT
jgi:hypothetical protein